MCSPCRDDDVDFLYLSIVYYLSKYVPTLEMVSNDDKEYIGAAKSILSI